MNFRIYLFLLLMLSGLVKIRGQSNKDSDGVFKRYFDKLLNDTNDLSAPKFMIYPTLAYSPETEMGDRIFKFIYLFG